MGDATRASDRFAHGFISVDGIDGVGVWAPRVEMSVSVHPAGGYAYTTVEEERWAALCAANPRVHDGEILAVRGVDFESCVVRCERERYKRLAVQPRDGHTSGASREGGGEVRILGVKGFITARDKEGGEHVLIGRRGRQTRVYGGLWETAPAGGVAVPPADVAELRVSDLAASVEEEGEEELGVRFGGDTGGHRDDARVVAVCRDYVAGSDDVFMAMELGGEIDPRRSPACQQHTDGWEYSDTAWLARGDAAAFDARSPAALIAPVRAVLRVLGWI